MTYSTLFSALADPTRRQILECLKDGPKSVSELSKTQPVSRPAVSQHLKILENAGLVKVERRGTQRIHSARREGLLALRDYLEDYWSDALSAFSEEIENNLGDNHVRPDKKDR